MAGELLFVNGEDLRLSRMSDDWMGVWNRFPTRNFFGTYILKESEVKELENVASEDDELEFDWLVVELDHFARQDLYEVMLDNEDALYDILKGRKNDRILDHFNEVFSYSSTEMSYDHLVDRVSVGLSKLADGVLDRLGDPHTNMAVLADLIGDEFERIG